MVQFTYHGPKKGTKEGDEQGTVNRKNKTCFGYNLVVIACMDTGIPVIWTLIPATGQERDATRKMIDALYRLRPDFPMEYLVGDGHYSGDGSPNSRQEGLSEFLYRRYGIHGVFPRNEGRSPNNLWAKSAGVPQCRHGLMKLSKEGEVWDAKKRQREGVPPGDPPPLGKGSRPRNRWRCPEENPDKRCLDAKTYLPDDWHLNTYLPHAGDSRKAATRSVILARRNAIESLFSRIKRLGVGSEWPLRKTWGGDDGMRWLTSLALLQITARKVVHLSGAYAESFQEAVEAGLVTPNEERLFGPRIPGADSRPAPGIRPEAGPPSSWDVDAKLPIDQEYLLDSLEQFSDEPDRPAAPNRGG
jgi:hypothetical protein